MKVRRIILGVIVVMITLATTISASTIVQNQANAAITRGSPSERNAPPAITGTNVYVAWWTNNTANNNEEVLFRASTDGGETFADKINLSNTTDADSTRVEIDSDANSVIVTWWETNDTSDVPVMRVSNDNGKTFGPLLTLSSNGTIASGEAEPAL